MNLGKRFHTCCRHGRAASLLVLLLASISCRPASPGAPAPAPVADNSASGASRNESARLVVHNNTPEAMLVDVVFLSGGSRRVGRVESRQSLSIKVPPRLVQAHEYFRVQVTSARAAGLGYLTRAVVVDPDGQVHVRLENPLSNSGIEVF